MLNKQAYLRGYLTKSAYDANYTINRASDQHRGSDVGDPLSGITKATVNDGITKKVDDNPEEGDGFISAEVKRQPFGQMYRLSRGRQM